nr:copia protein [Tanacetum cinerariifolium]
MEEEDAHLIFSMSVVYVLTTIPKDGENKTMEQIRRRNTWENDDYVCSGLILNASSENRPPMLNKENYVPWSSRLLRYAKSRPNGKLIHNSIINGPYVRRMIPEPGDPNRKVPVNETFHVQTDDELTEKELKQIEADNQAIQTILLGLPEDIYVAVDSCETAQEIWLRVQQTIKGSDIGIQEKKAKLFNETPQGDVDYAGCKDTFKSTSGGAQFLGEKLVSWSSKKQDYMTLSIAKAEYVSLSACCSQVLWMRT